MATLIYSTQFSEKGPWLLDADALGKLDDVLEAEWTRLSNHETQLIERGCAEELGARRTSSGDSHAINDDIRERIRGLVERSRERSLVFSLSNGHKLAVATFAEAGRHHELVRQRVIGAELKMRRGDVRIEVSISRGSNQLAFEARPEESDVARETFGAIYSWCRDVGPPAWHRWWAGSLLLRIAILWVALAYAATTLLSTGADNSKAELRQEAHRLLKDGITQAEQQRAIAILLAIESEYNVAATKRSLTPRQWVLLSSAAAACLLLVLFPRTTIGLGRGAAEVRWWRRWITLVGVTVPMLIFGNFIWPPVQAFLGRIW